MITKEKFTNDIYELNQLIGKESILLFSIHEEELIDMYNEYHDKAKKYLEMIEKVEIKYGQN